MESKADPSLGSHRSVIATLCDVAMVPGLSLRGFLVCESRAEAAGEQRAAVRVWGAQACAGKPR